MSDKFNQEYYSDITTLGFDADDTLWKNETFFRESEAKFAKLMSSYETENKTQQELFKYEMKNLKIYGYGIKGFILSMLECALDISNHKLDPKITEQILDMGKEMLNEPVELLDGIESVLKNLEGKYRLLLLTKGDLLDQERKLEKSGLSKYFHHVEVLSEKEERNYQELLDHLSIDPKNFVMIGNSLKSDVLPLINIGAKAIHIPFHTTWAHEQVEHNQGDEFLTVESASDLLKYF